MKIKSTFASVITSICVFFASFCNAEPTHPNEIGLYLNADGSGPTGSFDIGVAVFTFLVLTLPEPGEDEPDPNSPLTQFECRVVVDPNEIIVVDFTVAASGINYANFHENNELFFVFNEPLPFNPSAVLLGRVRMIAISWVPPPGVMLWPIGIGGMPPSIEGQMSYEVESGQRRIMHPISGSHSAPVFAFLDEAVSLENGSFGSVKVLYR